MPMDRLKTPLCSHLAIEWPIIQAPLGSVTCPELVAAVSNAGALGMLALSWREPADIAALVEATRALTDRPFGANLVLEWDQHERLKRALEAGVRIVSFFWGDPAPYVEIAHQAGALVLHSLAAPDEARRAVDAGVDIVVAQGYEAGGHVWGEVGTMVLVPAVVDAVAPVPVVAAGGIADGRGLAAALALGASGVWVGTRFLASREAIIHPAYQQAVLQAGVTDTAYTELFDIGWPNAPHRVLRNETIAAWEAAGRPEAPARPGEGETVATTGDGAPVARYSSAMPGAGVAGDAGAMALYAGQGVGLTGEVLPAGDIIAGMVSAARNLLA